jgi:hypothetical protein
MKLETDGVSDDRTARQPRPLDQAIAFLDRFIADPTLVVKGDDTLVGPRYVRHDEAYARIEFARMPLDLGEDAALVLGIQSSRITANSREDCVQGRGKNVAPRHQLPLG